MDHTPEKYRSGSAAQRWVLKVAEVFCNHVASVILSILVLLIVADVVLRYFLGKGMPGSYELTEYMFGLIIFFGLAYTQVKGRHVAVDLVVSRLSPRMRKAIGCFTYPATVFLLVLISLQTGLRAVTSYLRHEVSGVLGVPIAPFVFAAALGILAFLLVTLIDFVQSLKKGIKE